MKFDNDMFVLNKNCFEDLFELWKFGKPVSTLGPASNTMLDNSYYIVTPKGKLGICTTNLAGCALFIPKSVSDVLGYFNEDYGLYGAEDGDYGMRMNCTGFIQYYYEMNKYFLHRGEADNIDSKYEGVNKYSEFHSLTFHNQGGIGLFVLNTWLYKLCIRNWKVSSRYEVKDIDGYYVKVDEYYDYKYIKEALARSKKIFDCITDNINGKMLVNGYKLTDKLIIKLKKIWADCGQECKFDI